MIYTANCSLLYCLHKCIRTRCFCINTTQNPNFALVCNELFSMLAFTLKTYNSKTTMKYEIKKKTSLVMYTLSRPFDFPLPFGFILIKYYCIFGIIMVYIYNNNQSNYFWPPYIVPLLTEKSFHVKNENPKTNVIVYLYIFICRLSV